MSAMTEKELQIEQRPTAARVDWAKIGSYVFLLVIAVLYVGPLFMLLSTSFKPLNEFFRNATGLPEAFSFQNYVDAWELANFPGYLLNSVLYTVVATAIFVITTLFLAFPVARGYGRYSKYILALYVIALFLPPAFIPQFRLILNLGLYNTRIGYILLFLINPIGVIIMVNYIKSIPRELDESAAMDGCGYVRYVLTIILPPHPAGGGDGDCAARHRHLE